MDLSPSHAEVYREIFGDPTPGRVQRGASGAPILSKASGFLRGFDLTLQLQVGCPGGCLFCYVPSNAYFTSERARGREGRLWGYRLFDKDAAAAQFETALRAGALAGRAIYWSGVTDPYAAPPPVTRSIWRALLAAPDAQRPRRLVVQTRFRPDRDLELMSEYARRAEPLDGGPPVVVSYSVGTDREDLIRAWERATPPFAARMAAIERLRAAGVWVVPTLSPFAGWRDLPAALAAFQSWGIPYVTVLFFKQLSPRSRSATTPHRFLDYLRARHPHLLHPAWQRERLAEMQAIYGPARVLPGQAGFETLIRPHAVAGASPTPLA